MAILVGTSSISSISLSLYIYIHIHILYTCRIFHCHVWWSEDAMKLTRSSWITESNYKQLATWYLTENTSWCCVVETKWEAKSWRAIRVFLYGKYYPKITTSTPECVCESSSLPQVQNLQRRRRWNRLVIPNSVDFLGAQIPSLVDLVG